MLTGTVMSSMVYLVTSISRINIPLPWILGARPTQETQNGKSAKELAGARPNPMITGHQDWLDGLVAAVREKVGVQSTI